MMGDFELAMQMRAHPMTRSKRRRGAAPRVARRQEGSWSIGLDPGSWERVNIIVDPWEFEPTEAPSMPGGHPKSQSDCHHITQ